MSNQSDRNKKSKRIAADEAAVKRQVAILKSNLVYKAKSLDQPHRMSKLHAMDCGKPNCSLCSNPRKLFKELTIQEKRFYQNLDQVNDRKSNGSPKTND